MAGLKGQTGASMSRIERVPKVKHEIICFKCYHAKRNTKDRMWHCDKSMKSITWDKAVLKCKHFKKRGSGNAKTEHLKRLEKAKEFLAKLSPPKEFVPKKNKKKNPDKH